MWKALVLKAVLAATVVNGLAIYPPSTDPASALSIETVQQQFVNALLTPSVVPTFVPVALLRLIFPGVGAVMATGQAIPVSIASSMPGMTVYGTDADFGSGGPFSNNTLYTIIMIDADVPGANNTKGVNTHYLQNDIAWGSMTSDLLTLNLNASTPVIAYHAPAPASGSGPHRYTILLYSQSATFKAPATPARGSPVTMIDFNTYIKDAGLTQPLAGNYFTVELGNATVPFSATSSVDTATLPGAPAPTSVSSSPVSAKKNGATGKRESDFLMAGIFAVVVGLLILA